MYSGRNFIIFSVSELDKVDFTKVLETSADTVRKSVDGNKTFVKWDSEVAPEFISELSTKQGPFSYEEMLGILATEEWTAPMSTSMPGQ